MFAPFGGTNTTIWTGTKDEWSGKLDDMDAEDEYSERLEGVDDKMRG